MAEHVSPFRGLLEPLLTKIPFSLNADQISRLERHYELLLRWNQRINLTSIRDPSEIVRRHFGESLYLASQVSNEPGSVVDVGSGAGFPGVPLAVAFPDLRVTLAESRAKKAAFLKESCREMKNVTVFLGRWEELEGAFDWCVARAVGALGLLDAARRKCRRVALLVGKQGAKEVLGIEGFIWRPARHLPWISDTQLVVGEVSGYVPRETNVCDS